MNEFTTGACDHPTNFLLASIFAFLTGEGRPLGAEKVPWIIRPLILPAGESNKDRWEPTCEKIRITIKNRFKF